jgi:hypothetical protein
MANVLLRFAYILLAYGLSALAAGYAVYIALLIIPHGSSGYDAQTGGIAFGLVITMFVAIFAVAPASLVIAVCEFKSWRDWWYYAIAGAVIGLILGKVFSPPHWFAWLGLAFGPVSGLIYWGIVGRTAGLAIANQRLVIAGVFAIVTVLSSVITWAAFLGRMF